MEENINIIEILKNKPEGISLYSSVFGSCVYRGNCDNCIEVVTNDCYYFNEKGHYITNGVKSENGECLLFPSNEMRDWSKFAWKKGDVLVSEGMGRLHVIFEGFDDDTYLTFKGKHYLCIYDDNEDYNEEEYNDYRKEIILRTIEFKKDNVNDAKAYINTIEERLGGKLNLETLEVEKHQPEFKDGDIITVKLNNGDEIICIFKADVEERYYFYAYIDRGMVINNDNSYCSKTFCTPRLSTVTEKQQLFDALAKENKAWDAESKAIVDLKPKWTPKPFDRVITRTPDTPWTANFFSHIDSDGVKNCIDDRYLMCLPYNEETAKLIGTTNNWEG